MTIEVLLDQIPRYTHA